jgi:hypothetical protein
MQAQKPAELIPCTALWTGGLMHAKHRNRAHRMPCRRRKQVGCTDMRGGGRAQPLCQPRSLLLRFI